MNRKHYSIDITFIKELSLVQKENLMGFFSALMNGFSKAVADNLWPVFQQARRMDEHTLRAYIENETVSMRKAV